ncbi:MAG: diversity-generating retroelement protein Avd [Jaaginema sp. PMC 1079.18]|nr:diversity-generating retroelement protein Avd [Jaaginema sp. PMC 1080.18]MEC4853602.1 diversity-generating retroelement protein Avd [Jaaginema sp. PMC 1079.18]MEC4867984.1 diversity-generating retroelement protein Avd [Jaaginema sp. PMC 1078.18]
MKELPIIQKTYDLIQWYVPILNRLPKTHKFTLGDRIVSNLYDILEMLIRARYAREKLKTLEEINTQLDILRYQTRLLLDFKLISVERYQYINQLLQNIGNNLGGWIKQQKNETPRQSLSPNY